MSLYGFLTMCVGLYVRACVYTRMWQCYRRCIVLGVCHYLHLHDDNQHDIVTRTHMSLDVVMRYITQRTDGPMEYMRVYMQFAFMYFDARSVHAGVARPETHTCGRYCKHVMFGDFSFCMHSQNTHVCTPRMCIYRHETASCNVCGITGNVFPPSLEHHDFTKHMKTKKFGKQQRKSQKHRMRSVGEGSRAAITCSAIYQRIMAVTKSMWRDQADAIRGELATIQSRALVIWHHIYHSDAYTNKTTTRGKRTRPKSLRHTYKFSDHCIFILYAHIVGIRGMIPKSNIGAYLPSPRQLNGLKLPSGEYSLTRNTPTRIIFMHYFINPSFMQLVHDSMQT